MPTGVPDPDLSNNIETDKDAVGLQADLKVTVKDGTHSVTAEKTELHDSSR